MILVAQLNDELSNTKVLDLLLRGMIRSRAVLLQKREKGSLCVATWHPPTCAAVTLQVQV